MPLLPIETQARRSGLPPHEPIALVERFDSCDRVWCCNAAASRKGVRAGMPLTEARAVLPVLTAIPRAPATERQVLESLAVWANCLSPAVQPAPPDSLLLDVTGCERLFRGEANLLRQGIEGLWAHGFTVYGAIADTIGGAWAVAHGGGTPTVVPPGRTAAAIAPLPPWTLRIPRRHALTLEAVGVRKIEALLQIPRASIAARLGEEVLRRMDQALGLVPELLEPFRPPAAPVSRIRFAGATDRIEAIHEGLDRLLAFFCEQLVRRAMGVRQVLWTLYHEGAAPTTLEIGLSRATRSARHLRSLLITRLEVSALPAPVFAMMLWTRAAERWGDAQANLFDTAAGWGSGSREDGDDLASLLDRLANRLGTEAVVRPGLVEDHQPEYAYRYVPVIDSRETRRREGERTEQRRGETNGAGLSSAAPASDGGEPRPLRLFSRPIEVPAMALVPDGPPTWFRWGGRELSIVDAVGPERIETGWWRGSDVQRDYFAATSSTGRRFWLFRDRRTGRWFVHGSFD